MKPVHLLLSRLVVVFTKEISMSISGGGRCLVIKLYPSLCGTANSRDVSAGVTVVASEEELSEEVAGSFVGDWAVDEQRGPSEDRLLLSFLLQGPHLLELLFGPLLVRPGL